MILLFGAWKHAPKTNITDRLPCTDRTINDAVFCARIRSISAILACVVHSCLVLLQVPKCFVPVQIFWASPKIWLHLVPLQKLLCRHKKQFYWMQIIFLSGTKCLWLPQNVNRFLVRHKKFGPAQNILWPVKGQGMRHWKQQCLNLSLFELLKFWIFLIQP